jgi:hypothetical protein
MLKQDISDSMGISPSNDAVKSILKKDMKLQYKQIRHQGEYVKKKQNIDLR